MSVQMCKSSKVCVNSIDNETEDILKQKTSEECTIKKKE